MRLAEAVRLSLGDVLGPSMTLPSTPRLAKAVAAVEERMERVGNLQPVDLAALRRRLERGEELAALTPREFKHVADLLWSPPPLAASPAFLTPYLGELRRRESRPALRRLAFTWLMSFAPGGPAQAEIAALLRAERHLLRGPWGEQVIAQRLFEVGRGPSSLAVELGRGPGAPAEALERHGLKAVAAGGFVEATFRALLTVLRHSLARQPPDGAQLERVLGLARSQDGKPRFQACQPALADALLTPFQDEDPPVAMRDLIERELLERLGDPRLEAGRWAGVGEAAREVMQRWLAEATLEAFLAIVQKYAEPGHWRYREAFWRAYFRAGRIRSVQVAFRKQAAAEVRRLARKDNRLLAFAELGGIGTQANHAVLLLRIGDLTAAEWSHNGALRIWRPSHPQAPRLTTRYFNGPELKAPSDFRVIHHPQGVWQAKAASFIKHETGLSVSEADYMPRK